MHEHRSTFRVTKMCQVLQASRSGYYAWRDRPPSPRAIRRAERREQIQRIFTQSRGRYGSPKITAVLRQTGERIAQKTVARMMRDAGLRSRVVRKYKATTNSRHAHPVAENVLNRQFVAERPHQVWMTDITYIATDEGWLYLASVEDLYSRQIVGRLDGAATDIDNPPVPKDGTASICLTLLRISRVRGLDTSPEYQSARSVTASRSFRPVPTMTDPVAGFRSRNP